MERTSPSSSNVELLGHPGEGEQEGEPDREQHRDPEARRSKQHRYEHAESDDACDLSHLGPLPVASP